MLKPCVQKQAIGGTTIRFHPLNEESPYGEFLSFWVFPRFCRNTVDGRNPAPPGM